MQKHADRIFTFYVFIFVFALLRPSFVFSQSAPRKKKIVVLFMTPLEVADACRADLKGFSYLFERGAPGLMNARTARTGSAGAAYLTLNVSVRAYGGHGNMWNTWEVPDAYSAGKMYFQNTGMFPQARSVAAPYVKRLYDENKRNAYPVEVGILGSVLREHGFRRAVLGNADAGKNEHREAALFLMDENGLVDTGNVSRKLLLKDDGAFFGKRTDYRKLLNAFFSAFDDADVLSVDTGDFYRLEEAAKAATEEAWLSQKEKRLREANAFLLEVISFLNQQSEKGQGWMLFALSAQPSGGARASGDLLAPVFMLSDSGKRGLLTSSSTRQDGVIANLDIAPSVLSAHGIPKPDGMLGRPVRVSASSLSKDARGFLCEWHPRLVALQKMNTPILRTLIVVQGALVVIFFALFISPKTNKNAFVPARQCALLWGAGQPLFLLLLGAFPVVSWSGTLALFLVLSFLITLALTLAFRPVRAFFFLAALTMLLIAVDGARGSPWMMYSALGFSLMGGSRYYGIGNEYMGILLSSAWLSYGLFGDAFLQEKKRFMRLYTRGMCLPYGLLFCAVIGLPSLGANFGGLLASLGALFWMLKECFSVRLRFRELLFGFALLACAAAVFVFLDAARGDAASHFGKFFLEVKTEGFSAFWATAARKLSMNIKLIQYTLWTKVLLVCGAFIVYLFRRKPQAFKALFSVYPLTAAAMRAVLAGGAVGLLVNDSGIIVATTCVLGLSFTLLYLLFFAEEAVVRGQGGKGARGQV